MARSAVFSVIFPGNLPYFHDFLRSLKEQTDQHFDLFLLCDQTPEIESYLVPFREAYPIIVHHLTGTIASIREQGLAIISTLPYEQIIFADTDDLLGSRRIEHSVAALKISPLVVSDLTLIDQDGRLINDALWAQRIADRHRFDRKFIEKSNIVGLGNTGIRKDVLRPVKLHDDLIAVDWFLFFHLMEKNEAIFIHEGECCYRQHQSNTVGASGVSEKKLRQSVQVKVIHYSHLVATGATFNEPLLRHQQLSARISSDEQFLSAAVQSLSNKSIPYFWWEETEYIHE